MDDLEYRSVPVRPEELGLASQNEGSEDRGLHSRDYGHIGPNLAASRFLPGDMLFGPEGALISRLQSWSKQSPWRIRPILGDGNNYVIPQVFGELRSRIRQINAVYNWSP